MPTPRRFDPRKVMEVAIGAMRQSVHEPREDDKADPLVGAVLYKPDGTIETACRGELRFGDHAEYTLLERKNRSSRLDAKAMQVEDGTARRHLNRFLELGLVRKAGSGPSTEYKVI